MLTLRIPKASLYVLDLDIERGKENKIEKVKSVKLKNIEQPLYTRVDAIGVVLGTVRVAIPSSLFNSSFPFIHPFKRFNPFKREQDGVAYTVVEDAIPVLNLWSHDRTVWSLDIQDLLPEYAGKPEGIRAFGIYSTQPIASQMALFQSDDSWANFLKALKEKKLKLQMHENKKWYIITTCNSSPTKSFGESKPDTDEIWLGAEDKDGFSREFDEEVFNKLPKQIGGC